MQLAIEWSKPIPLRSDRSMIYTLNLDRFDSESGIYVFARKWGRSYEALYVGQSMDVRARMRNHLNNLKLMRHIETAKTGSRVVIIGHPVTKRGQQLPKVLSVLERALIRHFLSDGHDLVNQQGMRIKRDEIVSAGRVPKGFVPSMMYLEKRKGE